MRRFYKLFAFRALSQSLSFSLNAQQWSPRKDQALHSIGSFRPFLLALFFFLLPTYHSQPSVTRLSVCRELQAADEKNRTPPRHVFSQSSQYPFGERMFEEGKSTNRIAQDGFPYTLRRSMLSELFHQACGVNEVFVVRLFFFSFFCESVETEMTQERDQRRHQA